MRWHKQPPDPLETLLRANRPRPDAEFEQVVLARLAHQRPDRRRGLPQVAGARALAGVAVTVLALAGATVAAGGVGHAAHGFVRFVSVGRYVDSVRHHESEDWSDPSWPGIWENSIPICHQQDGAWVVEHFLPVSAVLDLYQNRHDFTVTPYHSCPPPR